MKTLKAAILMALGISASAFAFHSGGVAECNGCHTMHNSLENKVMAGATSTQFAAPKYLLRGTDQSSACLTCHASASTRTTGYYVLTPGGDPATVNAAAAGGAYLPIQKTPGGDFGWLYNNYQWQPRAGTTEVSKGERHGHNVIAADFGLVADATLATAPGGNFPAANLHCSSCHDPHGKYRRLDTGDIVNSSLPIRGSGSYDTSADPVTGVYAVGTYRLLAGVGYQPKSTPTATAFANTAPDAVAPSAYNQYSAVVAYGQNMSEWCANCHGAIVENGYMSGQAGFTHPAGNNEKLDAFIVANYNAYVKTGDLTGTDGTALASLVPFERGTDDYSVLKPLVTTPNPTAAGTDNVQCLSCHRAHATGFDSMLRWSMAYEFVTDGDATGVPSYGDMTQPAGQKQAVAQGRTNAETEAAYYGRPATSFAPYQRVLCNKCHAKD